MRGYLEGHLVEAEIVAWTVSSSAGDLLFCIAIRPCRVRSSLHRSGPFAGRQAWDAERYASRHSLFENHVRDKLQPMRSCDVEEFHSPFLATHPPRQRFDRHRPLERLAWISRRLLSS